MAVLNTVFKGLFMFIDTIDECFEHCFNRLFMFIDTIDESFEHCFKGLFMVHNIDENMD